MLRYAFQPHTPHTHIPVLPNAQDWSSLLHYRSLSFAWGQHQRRAGLTTQPSLRCMLVRPPWGRAMVRASKHSTHT